MGGREGGGGGISSSRENPRRTLIKAVMFYRSHFSMPPLTALEVIKLWASTKEREREGVSGKEKEESERDHGRKKRGKDRWRLERERERTINNSTETGCQVSFGC